MKYTIKKSEYKTIEQNIKDEMRQAAKEAIGYDEWDGESICYVAYNADEFVGTIVFDILYGQMCIYYVVVAKGYRNQGIGSELLFKAFEVAIERGCDFAYLETLNFQAPKFYEKHGFLLEFSRSGYRHDIVFNYYKKTFK
jgi:ribosomal protein S18 acetylase RimI-like enzyme